MKEELWNIREPDPIVVEIPKLVFSGDVLDLGAGQGRDSFYLAQQGFTVTAVEIDDINLKVLRETNKLETNKIDIVESDVLQYKPEQQFDVVVCDMILHFLSHENITSMIKKIQSWTKIGGYNAVMAYSDKNKLGKRPYLFKHNELLEYYRDWTVVSYEEKPTPWFIKPGETSPRRNHAAYLLTKKTKNG